MTSLVGASIQYPVTTTVFFGYLLNVIEDVVAGNAEIGAVTAASIVRAMEADQLQPLAVSAPKRLGGLFSGVPTWREQGIDCVVGAWRGVTGPVDLTDLQVASWSDLLKRATETQSWLDELKTNHWSAFYLDGSNLQTYLNSERQNFESLLASLGLLQI